MLLVIVGVQKSGDTTIILMDNDRPDKTIFTSLENWDEFIKEVKRGDYDVDSLLEES